MRKLEMTEKEIDRVKILEKVIEGRLTQKKASETLKISLRQIKRLCKRYRSKGAEGLIHLSRGKPSNRCMDKKMRAKVINIIVEEKFDGFGPTILQETLEEYGVKVSREWLRRQMIIEGRWQAKKVKKANTHPRRKRRSRRGELIQLDGRCRRNKKLKKMTFILDGIKSSLTQSLRNRSKWLKVTFSCCAN